jgi:hypothetical protein
LTGFDLDLELEGGGWALESELGLEKEPSDFQPEGHLYRQLRLFLFGILDTLLPFKSTFCHVVILGILTCSTTKPSPCIPHKTTRNPSQQISIQEDAKSEHGKERIGSVSIESEWDQGTE